MPPLILVKDPDRSPSVAELSGPDAPSAVHATAPADLLVSQLAALETEQAAGIVLWGIDQLPLGFLLGWTGRPFVAVLDEHDGALIEAENFWRQSRAAALVLAHARIVVAEAPPAGWGEVLGPSPLLAADPAAAWAAAQASFGGLGATRPVTRSPAVDAELSRIWNARRALASGSQASFLRATRAGLAAPLPRHPPRERPRILAISHDLSRTGAPLALLHSLVALEAQRPEWEILVLGLGEGALEADFRAHFGERFHRIDHEHGKAIPVLEAIDELAPSLLLLNSTTLYCYALLLGWKGLPFVWWSHEGLNVEARDGHLFSDPALERMTRLALSTAPRVLSSAQDTCRELEELVPELQGRTGVVPYGFDLDRMEEARRQAVSNRDALRSERGVRPGDRLITCVGSLVERKNQALLLEAFQILLRGLGPAEAARWKLQFIGDDQAEPDYAARLAAAVEPAFTERIAFLGPLPSAWPDLVASDIHVLVSTNECSPLVNLEAQLLGTIAVSSRVHGIPEVIADGERGFLVDPTDAPALAKRLESLGRMQDREPAALAAIRTEARRWAREHHAIAGSARQLGRALDELLITASVISRRGFHHGETANRYFEQELMRLWSVTKEDAVTEMHQVRARLATLTESSGKRSGLVRRLRQRWERWLGR